MEEQHVLPYVNISGQCFTACICTQVESIMENIFYDGKSRTFTLKCYTQTLKHSFNDMEEMSKLVTESRKVRELLRGLKDSKYEREVNTTMLTPWLNTNYMLTVTHIETYLRQQNSVVTSNPNHSVGLTNTLI